MATRNENDTTRSNTPNTPDNKGTKKPEQNPTGSTTRPDPNASERTGASGTRTDLREDRNQREDRENRDEDRRSK